MIRNMGRIDRLGRVLIALLLAYLALGAGLLNGAFFWIAIAVASVFLVTALLGNCPLYSIFGFKTCRDC